MKNTIRVIVINLMLLSLFSYFVSSINCVSGGPDTGSTFYGYAISSSGGVLAGKTVTAATDDDSISVTTDSNGYYYITIGKCSGSSDTVTFTVCTRSAGTGTYSEGQTAGKELNLTALSACPTPTTTSPGGGGGTPSGGVTITPTEAVGLDAEPDFLTDKGHTATQSQGDTTSFTVSGGVYTIELTTLKDDSVTITIGDESKVLNIGDSVRFDVNGDGINDISATLVGIAGGRAEITYRGFVGFEAFDIIDAIKTFYEGTSGYSAFDVIDIIKNFYAGG